MADDKQEKAFREHTAAQQKPALAVALTYDQERPPFVAATGRGVIAEQIVRIARDHDILIHEDPALVESLAMLSLGDEIPEVLYQAIAEVISFAYSLRSHEDLEQLRKAVGRKAADVQEDRDDPQTE